MISLIGRLFGRTEFEWRLYFVRKGVGLEYALHNKSAWGPLGYLQGAFERGVSDFRRMEAVYELLHRLQRRSVSIDRSDVH
jgi:hypothetical protein